MAAYRIKQVGFECDRQTQADVLYHMAVIGLCNLLPWGETPAGEPVCGV